MKLLRELLEAATQYPNLWVVFYRVKTNPRNTGSYLVNAPSKSAANAIVKAIPPDNVYYGMRAVTVEEAAGDYSMYEEDFLGDLEIPREAGEWTHIESGT